MNDDDNDLIRKSFDQDCYALRFVSKKEKKKKEIFKN